MRRFVLSLLLGLIVVSAVPAQFPITVAPTWMGQAYPTEVPVVEDDPYAGPNWVFDLDYLYWFVKPANVIAPMVATTTDPNANLGVYPVGRLSDQNAVVLFGGGSRDRAPYSGLKLTITHALPVTLDRSAYWEFSALWLPRQGNHRRVESTPDGNPAITLPFANAQLLNSRATPPPQAEQALLVAGNINGVRRQGSVDAYTATQWWGAEYNLCGSFWARRFRPNGPGSAPIDVRAECLIGLRYLGMNDLLQLDVRSRLPGGTLGLYDRFATTNHFYGGQIGGRLVCISDRLMSTITMKAGVGDTQSLLEIRGESSIPGVRQGTQLPGGFYTSRSNIGDSDRHRIGAVMDTNLGVRCAITQGIALSLGYNFVYWSGIQRAGEQVDHSINPSYNSFLSRAPGVVPFTGPAEPARREQFTDIWAHGVNVGLDLRY